MSESRAEIRLGAALVGRLVRVSDTSTFCFDEGYLSDRNRPVLGRVFEVARSPSAQWVGRRNELPTFFRHYLPEEGTLLRAAIAQEHNIKESNELGLLLALGGQLPGALVAIGGGGAAREAQPVGRTSIRLGFSLAGAQLKFAMFERDRKLVLRGDEADGAWIVKLYGERHVGAVYNEFSMMTLAREAGIEVPACRIVTEADLGELPPRFAAPSLSAIAIARYDRAPGFPRVHQEDFAQVFDVPATADARYSRRLPKGRKKLGYESIARVIAALCGRDDVLEFARRLAFCVVIGNEHAHLKNWSLVYPDGIQARLSPAYDLLSTVVYSDLHRELALSFFGESRLDSVSMSHFDALADSVAVEREVMRRVVREMLDRLREAWARLQGALPLIEAHRRVLDARIGAARWA